MVEANGLAMVKLLGSRPSDPSFFVVKKFGDKEDNFDGSREIRKSDEHGNLTSKKATSKLFGRCSGIIAVMKASSTSFAYSSGSRIMRVMHVSSQLGKFLGASKASRTDAFKKTWDYITLHKLQLQFGVNSGASRFVIEHQDVNEAKFCCPDEMEWKPQTSPLAKKRYEVMTFDDAGWFVYNYVYCHSLCFVEQNETKSLFVHVPLLLNIDQETQMKFTASLLEVLASLCQ
ncbi:hypothetical protein REPUB_Repub08aG0111700 [Reevesia pubescens]